MPATPTCGPSCARRPGLISTTRAWERASVSVRSEHHLRPWPDRGRPSPGSPLASVNSVPTRTCARSWLQPSPVSSPASYGPRWWPRTDDRPFGHGAIGPIVTESFTTRRRSAAADPILAGVMPERRQHGGVTCAQIQRQLPANGFIAILTREHHRGGSPIHCAPARRRVHPRPPPRALRGAE